MKRPWFPFYAADWLANGDVTSMSLAEQGAYVRLLAYQWREGSIPSNTARIYRLLCLSYPAPYDEETFCLDRVLEKFEDLGDGRLRNPRLEEVRKESEKKITELSEAGKRGADRRWGGHGNPNGLEMARSQSQSHTQSDTEKEHTSAAPPLELVPVTADPVFDFASVYAQYPRKEGKTKGIARLRSQVRTPEAFESLMRAVGHFAEKHRAENTEAQFIPHFSTWCSGAWRDYIDGANIVEKKTGAAAKSGWREPMAHVAETKDETDDL